VTNLEQFRERCREEGIPLTRQREVIYETLLALGGHPSLEELYVAACAKDASISLATVYNNVRKFLDSGLIRELSPVHGGLRIEANATPHHHLICTVCQRVRDLEESDLEPLRLRRGIKIKNFTVNRFNVDVLGVCADCAHPSMGKNKDKVIPLKNKPI
jgi:Fur family peroxide stress response transcriptional regulator